MTCIKMQNGFICVTDRIVDLKPFGSNVWCEYHSWFGPRFETKQGREIANPSPKTWAAFGAWLSTTAAPDGEGEKS